LSFHLFFETEKSITNVNIGRPYRPCYARLAQNLKKQKEWRSIEVHAIYSLFFILGYSLEGLRVLQKFLNSTHDEIYNPLFLAQMVLSPLNSIIQDVLILEAQDEYEVSSTTWDKHRNKKSKLLVLFRFDILCRMLDILQEFGSNPTFTNQKFVSKLMQSKDFGLNASSSGNRSSTFVTGFTAAFFLTLPELFIQWKEQKDGNCKKPEMYKILEFVGEQCLWPTFTKSLGVMHSNAKSVTPYSYLPDTFDLKILFKECLAGNIIWKTVSLCEETKMIESPKKATKKPEDEDDVEDEIGEDRTGEDMEEEEQEQEEQDAADENMAAGEDEEDEEKTKPADVTKTAKRKRRNSKTKPPAAQEGQEAEEVKKTVEEEKVAAKSASESDDSSSSEDEEEQSDRIKTDISEQFDALMYELEECPPDIFIQNPSLHRCYENIEKWKNSRIWAEKLNFGEEEKEEKEDE
jgi:hypothetical protein